MTFAEQEMQTLLSEASELGLPRDDLIDLVRAAMTGPPVERMMRIRALAELSAHVDATTLIMLAAAAVEHGPAIGELAAAMGVRRH